jgi:hypothetical protein
VSKLSQSDIFTQYKFVIKGTKVLLVKEYAPKVFHYLRQLSKVNEDCFKYSLTNPNLNILGDGLGKSGSFLFTTNDKKFILKTIDLNEVRFILSYLQKYVEVNLMNKKSI